MKKNEVKTKILKQERYKIKTPKRIRIYDEIYLNDSNASDLCAIIDDISRNKKSELIFEVVEDTFISEYTKKSVTTKSFVAKIFISSDQSILDTFFENKYHPGFVKFKKQLGCDTASFVIEIDDVYCDIDTGADGYYGEHIAYKYNKAHRIEFYVSSEMTSEIEFRSKLSFLFDLDEIMEGLFV